MSEFDLSLHDLVGHTPYEGNVVMGWPEIVTSAGRNIVESGELHAPPRSARFIPCSAPAMQSPERLLSPSATFFRKLALPRNSEPTHS